MKNGIGLALAAAVAATIALGWGWFRASAAVAALSELSLGQAVGLCVGGGFVLIIAGAGLSGAGGGVGAIGAFVLFLGFVLPTALLLGRHSAEVQRGQAKPALKRERMPEWVTRVVAGLMVAIFLVGLGQALFAGSAGSSGISTQLRDEAETSVEVLGGRELAAAGGSTNSLFATCAISSASIRPVPQSSPRRRPAP